MTVYAPRFADYRAPSGCILADRLWALGVLRADVFAWAEPFGRDSAAAWADALSTRSLDRILCVALARECSTQEVGRAGAMWIERVADATGWRFEPAIEKQVRVALDVMRSRDVWRHAPQLHTRLLGEKPRAGIVLVSATVQALELTTRNLRIGSAAPAALIGEFVRTVIDRDIGPLMAPPLLTELVAIAERELREPAWRHAG